MAVAYLEIDLRFTQLTLGGMLWPHKWVCWVLKPCHSPFGIMAYIPKKDFKKNFTNWTFRNSWLTNWMACQSHCKELEPPMGRKFFTNKDRGAMFGEANFHPPEKAVRIGDHPKNEFQYWSSRNHSDDDLFYWLKLYWQKSIRHGNCFWVLSILAEKEVPDRF